RFFNNFIDPLYRDSEAVAKDYMALFAELVWRLEKAATVDDVITWLEERRPLYQPVRMKIRALLNDKKLAKISGDNGAEAVVRFSKGLWGMMKGGAFLTQKDGDAMEHNGLHEYGYNDHAILDLLRFFRKQPTVLTKPQRERLVGRAQEQQRAIE